MTKNNELREKVLQNYTIAEVALMCGAKLKKSKEGYRSACPYDTGSNETRMIYYTDSNLYADCAENGPYSPHDLITLYAKCQNISYPEALKELAQKKGIYNTPPVDPYHKKSLNATCTFFNDTLKKEKYQAILKYLKDRGYTEELINKKLIGYRELDKRIIFPFFENGKVVYFQARQLPEEVFKEVYPGLSYQAIYSNDNYNNSGKYKKANTQKYGPECNKDVPYNYDFIDYSKNQYIYLCEGIADSDSLLFENQNNICVGSTNASSKEWQDYIIPTLKKFKRIIILGDNDQAGRKATVNWAKELMKNKIYNFDFEVIPRGVFETTAQLFLETHFFSDEIVKEKIGDSLKDINDYYIANNFSLSGLDKTRMDGFVYLARYYKDLDPRYAVYDYLIHVIDDIYRDVPKFHINAILKNLENEDIFTTAELNYLRDKTREAPSEVQIVKEVLWDHDLIYNTSVGFYEYDGKTWVSKDDAIPGIYIADHLGDRFTTGSKIRSILTVLTNNKYVYKQEIEFNKKDAVVFENGTLYLNKDKPVFKEAFNKNDFMTFKSPFNYDPEAKCPKWENFLADCLETRKANGSINTTETNKKIAMLQEFAGYILFSDCSLHKALVLSGNGGNGKSVFNNTIAKLFDSESISKVPANKLEDTFANYCLKDSILNISDETKNSLFGNETAIKEIVVGGDLIGSKKFKDITKFKVRAKLIITANNPIQVEDKSNGLPRRLLFVDFDWKYTDDENLLKNSNYNKRLITNLEAELEDELPGIFNWAVEGYKRLKKNKKFSESKESNLKRENFKSSNNPTRVFIVEEILKSIYDSYLEDIKDFIPQLEYGINNLYSLFRSFCEENGYNYRKKEIFGREFSRELKDLNINFEKKLVTNNGIREIVYYLDIDRYTIKNLEFILASI